MHVFESDILQFIGREILSHTSYGHVEDVSYKIVFKGAISSMLLSLVYARYPALITKPGKMTALAEIMGDIPHTF